jgi:uncharacterized membrane protein
MKELIKNIGLGLFVNGSFSIMNNDVNINTISVTIGSIFIMWTMIHYQKKEI